MNIYQVKTNSVEETTELAIKLASYLKPGNVITLEGELGSGKTMFTKGIAAGLGIKAIVTSPTFTIIKEYEGNMPLYHMDAYRLEFSEEDIGFSEYFNGSGVCVVEWAKFINDYLPSELLNIKVNHTGDHSRLLEFEPIGIKYEEMIKELIGRK